MNNICENETTLNILIYYLYNKIGLLLMQQQKIEDIHLKKTFKQEKKLQVK